MARIGRHRLKSNQAIDANDRVKTGQSWITRHDFAHAITHGWGAPPRSAELHGARQGTAKREKFGRDLASRINELITLHHTNS